jgi:hypothetical protein
MGLDLLQHSYPWVNEELCINYRSMAPNLVSPREFPQFKAAGRRSFNGSEKLKSRNYFRQMRPKSVLQKGAAYQYIRLDSEE